MLVVRSLFKEKDRKPKEHNKANEASFLALWLVLLLFAL
jgi:hypothetical protein